MARADKCPYCSSKDIKRTTNGWIAEGAGVALNMAGSALLGMIGFNAHGLAGRKMIKTEYICNRCQKIWKTTESDDKIIVHK